MFEEILHSVYWFAESSTVWPKRDSSVDY